MAKDETLRVEAQMALAVLHGAPEAGWPPLSPAGRREVAGQAAFLRPAARRQQAQPIASALSALAPHLEGEAYADALRQALQAA